MSRYRAGATWVRVWRTGTYNDFHLLPRKLGIEDRVAILSSSPVAPFAAVWFSSCASTDTLRFPATFFSHFVEKVDTYGNSVKAAARPTFTLALVPATSLFLSLYLGVALRPYLLPQRHPFCTLRSNDPAVARSCRQSSPEDSAIRTSALASFPRWVLRETAIFRSLLYVRFYNDFAMKIHLLE